jgi:uncharacterized membrane protein
MLPTIAQLNAMVLRPFRTQVDIETVALLLALLMVSAGLWHLVLERIEL